MGGIGFIHWIVLITVVALYVVPISQILKRVGYSRWLTLLALIPLVNFICFWIFAFAPWPRDRAPTE
ncbi:hypothetical protein [Caulobacter sp. SSI4214]|uniref:hypothetical protein n=1 Tax=Caulobacter sp. SSI4214 TaxID=2575739 RepID=UPI001F50D8BD|nr:hypothetical protein [Caulobacter sp. SSI4214]